MKTKVLIADDSLSYRKVTAMTLRVAGFDIIEADDGLQAIGKVLNQKPDILLLDLNMPKLSGWEICEKIRSTPEIQALPIIIMSSQSLLGDVKLARRYKVGAYLIKPVPMDKLAQKIKEVLASPPSNNQSEEKSSEPAKAVKIDYPTYPLRVEAGVAVLSLGGEIDAPQMINESITKALKEHSKKLLIDLSLADKVKAQSLIAISRAGRLANGLGGSVKVVLDNPQVIKDFEIAKELEFLDRYLTLEEAIASFNK